MTATDTYLLLRALADELGRCGMREVCTSPGSRSAPLVLSLVREPRLRAHSHLDERSAGFFAVGAAKASGRPVAVACTSGTAAAELAPAVHEAHEARVPLVVLTADRPPELRDVGAGQVIDQIKLYGSAAKWFVEVGTHEATPERLRWMRALGCRAYWTALTGRPGVVHLNFALREPLVLDEELPAGEPGGGGRADGRPWVERPAVQLRAAPGSLERLAAEVRGSERGVLVLGRHERDLGLPAAADALARAAGWPLLADPLSGARSGPAAVAHYDALLRDGRFAAAHRPDLVLRVGDLPTSKPLRGWLSGLDARQVAIEDEGAWPDPDAVLGALVAAEPGPVLGALAGALGGRDGDAGGWLASWQRADGVAAAAIHATLEAEALSEPLVAAELGRNLPGAATVFVASSMPVRDVETFWPAREDPPRVLSNRGANGIDGTISAAFGAAAAGAGAGAGPVVALIGDVALAHDLQGLGAARRLGLDLTVVLLDNGGGGIFHFLPVAGESDAFEEHVATPHGLDFGSAAALHGCAHEVVPDVGALRTALDRALSGPGTRIIEVRTDREANVATHRRVWAAVERALRAEE
jgi:2-succinyl-5-enolpyruvyl-6-hydroxy-3-cyclohexene-1-carboxylate synthase